MNRSTPSRKQQGVALILSLLLLFVLVLIGVAGFNNTHVQERSAGNARLQAVAFEAAAAGANNAINFFDAHHGLGPDQLCGTPDHEGWEGPTAWVNMGAVGGATLRQRLYSLADEYPCSAEEQAALFCTPGDRPPSSQLFVLSRGEVTVDGKIVAQRDVEVRLELGSTGGAGDGCGAICIPGCSTGTMTFPNSNKFFVRGGGGPAITAGCQAAANQIMAATELSNTPQANYVGGIAATTPGSPWDSPANVELFRQNLKASAQAAQAAGTCQANCYSDVSVNKSGNDRYGTSVDPQITYIEGDASFGGNISGAGILVVNGNLTWSGTPKFDGLIIVLGSTFSATGGGNGGNGGSLVVLNAKGATGDNFGPASLNFNPGGGNAEYKFNCTTLWDAHDMLDDAGKGMWSPECDVAPSNPYMAGPAELVIASWRENIGWRAGEYIAD